MSTDALDIPPFPRLEWDDYYWTGTAYLPSWADFQTRFGVYGGIQTSSPSDGSVSLLVACADEEERLPPLPEQVAAFQYLLDHERETAERILTAIFEAYMAARDMFFESAETMPEIERPDDLRRLIGLCKLHVLDVFHEKTAYLGFEFGCTWDVPSGLGVMVHKSRVIQVADASIASHEWLAEEDAKRGDEADEE